MKKILQIQYSGLGGTAAVFFSLVQACAQNIPNQYEHYAVFYGIEPLVQSYAEQCEHLNIDFRYFKKQSGLDLSHQNAIRKHLKTINPDIIILHSMQTIFACYAHTFLNKKTKLLVVEHQANHLKTQKEWFLSRLALKWAQQVIYLTPEYANEMAQKLPTLFHKAQKTVIPNGIDLNVFYPPQNKHAKHCATASIAIGMASRITPNKDHLTLIDAINLLKQKSYFTQLKLHIAGDGSELEKLKQKVSSLKLENTILFSGLLNEDELAVFLRSLSIYVHASYGETMSTAIMQAQATGLPIIGSHVKGINNVLFEGKNGLLYPVENAEILAQKIHQLITEPVLQAQFQAESLTFAQQNLSFQKMWNSYQNLF